MSKMQIRWRACDDRSSGSWPSAASVPDDRGHYSKPCHHRRRRGSGADHLRADERFPRPFRGDRARAGDSHRPRRAEAGAPERGGERPVGYRPHVPHVLGRFRTRPESGKGGTTPAGLARLAPLPRVGAWFRLCSRVHRARARHAHCGLVSHHDGSRHTAARPERRRRAQRGSVPTCSVSGPSASSDRSSWWPSFSRTRIR